MATATVPEGHPTPARWVPLLLLAGGQLMLALALFGPSPWAALADARPILCGRHPLHLYHGTLGAASFSERADASCYDPAFQAGYPKTPVFDGGSRPAELAFTLIGSPGTQTEGPDAAPYKLALWLLCGAVPLAFAWAAGGAGCGGSRSARQVVAGIGGCALWWSPPLRGLLDAGQVDLLGVGMAGLVFVGTLPRYSVHPGPTTWLLLALSHAAGWYCQPVVWCGLFPVGFLYYSLVAPRHGLAWHLGQVGAFAVGLVPNLWWLPDWVRFWWLRQPSIDDLGGLPDWDAVLGTPADYLTLLESNALGWGVVALGVAGLVALLLNGRRVLVGVVLTAVTVAVLFARLGQVWPTLKPLHAEHAASFAVAVLLLPASGLVGRWLSRVPHAAAAVLALAALPLAFALFGVRNPDPWPLDLSRDQHELIAGLRQHTTREARILVEDPDHLAGSDWNWTALLPLYADRYYLGGLDPEMAIEHGFCRLRAGSWNGRAFAEWTPGERAAAVRRYNVGWVLCRTPAAAGFWLKEPGATQVARYRDRGEVALIALNRPPSFVLRGEATVDRLDRQKIVLTDVSPDDENAVVLSLHYQPGMRCSPAMVAVEGEKDWTDPIPLVKLRLAGPTSRVVLTWENR